MFTSYSGPSAARALGTSSSVLTGCLGNTDNNKLCYNINNNNSNSSSNNSNNSSNSSNNNNNIIIIITGIVAIVVIITGPAVSGREA